MALPAGGTLRFVGQRRTALPGTPGPCAEFQNGLRKFFDAHRAPAAPRACDASEPSWAASEAHLRCTRKSTYENQRRCVRVVKSAASDAGDLGSSPGEVTFCNRPACSRLRRVLVALPLETSRPPSSRTAKHRMPHPGKPRRHGRGPARSLGRLPMQPKGSGEKRRNPAAPRNATRRTRSSLSASAATWGGRHWATDAMRVLKSPARRRTRRSVRYF